MSIATNILANGHSSPIVNLLSPKVRTNYFKKSETIDQPDIYDPAFVESENAFLSVIQFFKTSKITNAVFYRFIPTGNLAYKERLILQFSLTKQYAAYFPFLRGFLGFGKVAGLNVSVNTLNKTFEIEILSGGGKNVLTYLENIFSELLKESKFKSALKNVILVEQEIKKIQKQNFDALYISLQ